VSCRNGRQSSDSQTGSGNDKVQFGLDDVAGSERQSVRVGVARPAVLRSSIRRHGRRRRRRKRCRRLDRRCSSAHAQRH